MSYRRSVVGVGVLLLGTATGRGGAQTPSRSGPIVMRSAESSLLQWWTVDPQSGLAAFYGGDIVAICKNEPGAHDLLDLSTVDIPQRDTRSNTVAKGDDVGASLWEHAPPFNAHLCADILSRPGPIATGTAQVTATASDLESYLSADVKNRTTYGVMGRGTMNAPDGTVYRVTSHYRCTFGGQTGARDRCVQGVEVTPDPRDH
jgi:hypothetical protein